MSRLKTIEKLRAGVSAVKNVSWPYQDVIVGIRVLTEREYHDAQFAVDEEFQGKGVSVGSENIHAYEAELATQILFRSLVTINEKHEQFFESIDELREVLTSNVREVLISEMEDWQDECSPRISTMDDEKFSAFLEDVKKKPDEAVLKGLSSSILKKLTVTLAFQLQSLQTAK